jgi:hypothetical protein
MFPEYDGTIFSMLGNAKFSASWLKLKVAEEAAGQKAALGIISHRHDFPKRKPPLRLEGHLF